MKNNVPIISIITVSYNTVKNIEQTILNVLDQNLENYEFIVIDGGSTDGTLEVIKKYQDKISYWISEPDKGIYDAMNKGIIAASGFYVYFLNVGDEFYSKETLNNIIKLSNDEDVIYGDTCLIFDSKEIILQSKSRDIDWRTMPYCHQSVIIKRELLILNLFDISFKIAADYKQYHELKKSKAVFIAIDEIICRYDNNGFSAQNHSRLIKEYKKVSLMNAIGFLKKLRVSIFFLRCQIFHKISRLS